MGFNQFHGCWHRPGRWGASGLIKVRVASAKLRSFCAGLSHWGMHSWCISKYHRVVCFVSIISDYLERVIPLLVLLLRVDSPSQSVSTRFISEETFWCPQTLGKKITPSFGKVSFQLTIKITNFFFQIQIKYHFPLNLPKPLGKFRKVLVLFIL